MEKKNIIKDKDKDKNSLCDGKNIRLEKSDPTNNEGTAAWANAEKLQDRTNVTIPSDYSVRKAKNWVDNGSQT